MALTKADLAENLFEKLGFSKRDAKETVEVFSKRLENHSKVANR
ncbi:integration host factor alpha subunit [Vibrio variabilis]|uniref:Integration host factor alpha subunit n=1 Tax=Vibrio variabilis TaxID=990271 RepID=A0ABQ0JB90_9VIBR|nr:integration host factor alpha subunit [Vibrio variabilis]